MGGEGAATTVAKKENWKNKTKRLKGLPLGPNKKNEKSNYKKNE